MKQTSRLAWPFLVMAVLSVAACSHFARSPSSGSDARSVKHVRFLHIADTHAQLDTHWEYLPEDPDHLHRMGGYARLRTALDQARASAPGAAFTVDGGDTFQGSAVAAWTQGEAIVGPLNALGIDVGTTGNWEVVYGPEAFRKLMSEVNYKVVVYNFSDTRTGKRLFAPATVMEKDGVKVVFVGVTDPTTTTRQPPAEVKGIDSTHIEGLRAFVQDLKAKERPDLTVLVDHTGLAPSVQLAHEIPEFDVVLSGHTHERVYKPIMVGHTIVVEPGSLGSFIGQLDLTLKDGKIVDHQYRLVYVDADRFPENEQVKALIEKNESPFKKKLSKVIGETKTTLLRYDVLESTMDDLVADSVNEKTHADISFTNGFRYSPPIPPGKITEKDLWDMLPLDARIKVGTVSGAQLWKYLEHEMELVFAKDPMALSGGWGPRPSQGLWVRFEAKAPEGQRIREIKIDGLPIQMDKQYRMGGCERDGEPMDMLCRFTGLSHAKYVRGSVHEAIRDYLKNHVLDYRREGRVRASDLPESVWSQYGMLQKMWDLPGDASAMDPPAS